MQGKIETIIFLRGFYGTKPTFSWALCMNNQVKRPGGKAHLAIRAFFSWPITGPHTSATAQHFHWTPILRSDKAPSNVHIVSGPIGQAAHPYYQHKRFDKKINDVTIKKQKKKKEDSWLSNELSNIMEISLLCYIKAYKTTAEYHSSFFKTILAKATRSGLQWMKGSVKEGKLN